MQNTAGGVIWARFSNENTDSYRAIKLYWEGVGYGVVAVLSSDRPRKRSNKKLTLQSHHPGHAFLNPLPSQAPPRLGEGGQGARVFP